jgi:hypothetical protein
MKINIPVGAKQVLAHAAIGKYALSDAHGLVLIGSHSRAPQGSGFVQIRMSDRQMIHWPGSNQLGGEVDMVIDLEVDDVQVIVEGEGRPDTIRETVPGDLFVDEKGVYIVGKRYASGAPNVMGVHTRQSEHNEIGRGQIFDKWKLIGRRKGEVVFEVELGAS